MGVKFDEEGNEILICSGRLKNVGFTTRFGHNEPILLPADHFFTKLLIKNYHERSYHQGVEYTLS